MNDEPYVNNDFRAGFIAVVGKPNVGKSTLINRLLGQKIAAVTNRPQTTRKKQLGILTRPDSQLVFMDTPGIHEAKHRLGKRMNEEAYVVLEECDLVLVLVDGSENPKKEDRTISQSVRQPGISSQGLIVLNKIDLVSEEVLKQNQEAFHLLFPAYDMVEISATRGVHLDELLLALIEKLPLGFAFYPENQVTDLYEREIASDLIRESALLHLRDEIPHSVAVRIDEYKERDAKGAYIQATLFVERDSQKGIVIGKSGRMLKRLGSHARREIEAMSGRKVFLELRVKVRKNWRNDENTLDKFGFSRPR